MEVRAGLVAAEMADPFDEGDLELLEALQVHPRASWSKIGNALGRDPDVCARRWRSFQEAGVAWVTITWGQEYLRRSTVIVVEIECDPARTYEVARRLSLMNEVVTVQLIGGSHQVWVLGVWPNPRQAAGSLFETIPAVPGVRRVRSRVAPAVYATSEQWRLRVLSRPTSRGLEEPARPSVTSRPLDEVDLTLAYHLLSDGRMTFAELGSRIGMSARTAQRRVERMQRSGAIEFRCDLARPLAGWHSSAIIEASAPPGDVEAIGQAMARWPSGRTCTTITGASDLLITVGLRSIGELDAITRRLTASFPGTTIGRRELVMRPLKRYGRLLDGLGRSVGAVPLLSRAADPTG